MKPQKSQRVCVLNVGRTHTVARTIAIAPFFGEVYYLDVADVASPEDFNGTKVVYKRPFGTNSSRFLGVFKLIKYLKRLQPDVIICFFVAGPMYMAALLYRRCPLVGVAMGNDVFYELGDTHIPDIDRLLIRMCLRETSMIIAKSRTLMERIREFGVFCPVVVNYWGCDLRRFTIAPKSQTRQNLGLPVDPFIVLSPRAIDPLYNIDLIVEAFNLACKKIPNMHLVVIGRTSNSQLEYQNKLMKYVEENELRNNTTFQWDIDRDEVPAYIQAADIVVTAARCEGFPNTLFETMACLKPTVAIELPELRELLTDGVNVTFSEPSAIKLAGKLIWLSQSPETIEQMKQGGKVIVYKYGNIEKNARTFASQLTEILPEQNKSLSIVMAFCLISLHLISQSLGRIKRIISLARVKS